ncbi:nuclear transport factor 2 family protein [Sphingomonas sp.]|jgi:hypothetical protein|uniref:nuclear transport factor 2 family protein n=1 Tax=Sphingomonas sp. TaxID=28214 RepID=UPI002E34557C|nr:nuclear transport factor 2 family protein [Sphingomonas sp.]HEX4695752.1 nuclear transport factor 2 family protein [Sphingomonas sp.]
MIARIAAPVLTAVALVALPGAALADTCAPASAPRPTATVEAMYAAAMAGDKAAMAATLAPDFYAFDGGRRYSASEFVGFIDLLKAMKTTMAWTVTAPDEKIVCDVAWVTWDNRGSATDPTGTRKIEWLESAIERWQDGAWRLVFFHSTQVPPPGK